MTLDPKNIRAGEEQYEKYIPRMDRKKRTRVQYDYRDQDGTLFSCGAWSLEEARRLRDEWLAKRNTNS